MAKKQKLFPRAKVPTRVRRYKVPRPKDKKLQLPKKTRAASFHYVGEGEGRPPYEPTRGDREFVERLVAFGLTAEEVSICIESRYGNHISEDTLRKYFSVELKHGAMKQTVYVGDRLMTHIENGNVAAAMFYLKTRGRWATQVNLADPDGNPLNPGTTQVVVAFGKEDAGDDSLKQEVLASEH